MRFAELDAVTVDGYGTLVRLVDPVPVLAARARGARGRARAGRRAGGVPGGGRLLPARGAARAATPASLARCARECTRVFLEAAEADLDPASFVDAFMGAIVMEPEPGAVETLRSLRARGLELAVVSNWDIGLAEHLERLGLASLFSAIATTAEAGAPKPEPAVFRLALERLGVDAARALHVGDERGGRGGRRGRRDAVRAGAARDRLRGLGVSRVVDQRRLTGWLILVSALIFLGYGSRAAGGKPDQDVAYQYSTAVCGARPVRDHPRGRPRDHEAGVGAPRPPAPARARSSRRS